MAYRRDSYSLEVLTHLTRETDCVSVDDERPAGVTVVDGNHGGAKLPENRRSNKTFRVELLMFWMVL